MEELLKELRDSIDAIPNEAELTGSQFKEMIAHVVDWCEMEIERERKLCNFRIMVAEYEKRGKE